ncbi:MAG TPA: hypothetical protein VG123_17750 [Streptosporangiaceae bacterium]|nr:hypothetical protein [Streptosporangiaceae bacterium]
MIRLSVPRRPQLASPGTALALGGLLLMMVALAGVIGAAVGRGLLSGSASILLFVAFGAVGVVVAWHQPRNPVGWVLLGVAFFFTLSALAGLYTVFDYRLHQGTLPLGWLAVLLQPGWAPAVALAGLTVPLFPDGALPSRWWRPWLWVYLAAAGLWAGGAYVISVSAIASHHVHILANGDLSALDYPAGAAAAWGVLEAVFFPLIGLSWLAWLAGQILGYRHAPAEHRQQLKWLLTGVTIFIAGAVLTVWLNNPAGYWKILGYLAAAGSFALPVSIAMGILKFKLYDIDRIVSRTLSYAIVTGLLVGVYAGLVLLATQVLPLTSSVAVAGSTLAAAALFNPLRRRVQRVVDRRFNRARYDADQTVTRFAARLQDAVDLNGVRADLLGVVGRVLEPAHVSVWIAGSGP